MKRYAIKIGEIQLVSDKPITENYRKAAIEEIEEALQPGTFSMDMRVLTSLGLEIRVVLSGVNGH